MLGGYGGQYSFGHAAFFGTGAYATAILQVRYGVNAWAGLRARHRGRRARRRRHRRARASAPACAAPTSRWSRSPSPRCCASSRASRRSPARASARWSSSTCAPIRSKRFGVPVPEPRAVLLDHPRLRRGLAADRERLEGSRFGAYLVAVRENEDAARALGVDVMRVKLGAMTLSAAHHRRGRLLLRAVFPVRRCRHRLRPLDLGRGAARADHRRHRHGVRAAARRAGGAHARRGHQAR